MTVHDVSASLRADLPTWPGEPGMSRELISQQPDDPATVSRLSFGAHLGSHVDAPVHFLPDGGGIETFSPDVFVGECFVPDLRHVAGAIRAEHLEGAGVPANTLRIVALTRNSGWSRTDTEFRRDFVAYDETAAGWCLDRGIRLLGNDYLSIEPFGSDGHPVHKSLLGAGVAILEGLDLFDVEPGRYDLVALPILVPGSDGAPVRAVLIDR